MRAKLPNKIFDCIYIAWCQKLFSLTWYNDLTYAQSENISSTKELPVPYCNRSSYNSIELNYIQR